MTTRPRARTATSRCLASRPSRSRSRAARPPTRPLRRSSRPRPASTSSTRKPPPQPPARDRTRRWRCPPLPPTRWPPPRPPKARPRVGREQAMSSSHGTTPTARGRRRRRCPGPWPMPRCPRSPSYIPPPPTPPRRRSPPPLPRLTTPAPTRRTTTTILSEAGGCAATASRVVGAARVSLNRTQTSTKIPSTATPSSPRHGERSRTACVTSVATRRQRCCRKSPSSPAAAPSPSDPVYELPLSRLADVCIDDKDTDLAVSYLERVARIYRYRGDDKGALRVYRRIATIARYREDVLTLLMAAQGTGRIDA